MAIPTPNLSAEARLSKIAAAVAAFFMIISSVACHVNFTYTSLHSFTTEGAAKRGRGTHTHAWRGLWLLFVIRKPPELSSQHPTDGVTLYSCWTQTANGDCNSFFFSASIPLLISFCFFFFNVVVRIGVESVSVSHTLTQAGVGQMGQTNR